MMLIKLLLVSYLLTSCLITPPDGDDSRATSLSYLRNIEVTCITPMKCVNESAENFTLITIYTTAYCNNFSEFSPLLAIGGSNIDCDDDICTASVKSYTNVEGTEDLRDIVSGNYTVITFIDINKNRWPSNNEPYFCSDEVDISLNKKNTALAIEIKELW